MLARHARRATIALAFCLTWFGTALAEADADIVAAVNAAASVEGVQKAIEGLEGAEALEELLAALEVRDFADPIIEGIELARRQAVMAGDYRPCDVFFPDVAAILPESILSDESFLISTVGEADGGLIRIASEFAHDVISMPVLAGNGLSDGVPTFAPGNIHRIDGALSVMDGRITSETDKFDRATFVMMKDIGMVYIRGSGQVAQGDGSVVDLAGRAC